MRWLPKPVRLWALAANPPKPFPVPSVKGPQVFSTTSVVAELIVFRWSEGALAYRVEQHPLLGVDAMDDHARQLACPRDPHSVVVVPSSWRFNPAGKQVILTWAVLPDRYPEHDSVMLHDASNVKNTDWHEAATAAARQVAYLSSSNPDLLDAMSADSALREAFAHYG